MTAPGAVEARPPCPAAAPAWRLRFRPPALCYQAVMHAARMVCRAAPPTHHRRTASCSSSRSASSSMRRPPTAAPAADDALLIAAPVVGSAASKHVGVGVCQVHPCSAKLLPLNPKTKADMITRSHVQGGGAGNRTNQEGGALEGQPPYLWTVGEHLHAYSLQASCSWAAPFRRDTSSSTAQHSRTMRRPPCRLQVDCRSRAQR